MSEVLNFYLQKYGLLEKQEEDIKINTNERARQRWELLRKSMANVSEIIEKEDLIDNKISHGIQFIRRMSHANDIEQAMHIPTTDTYLTLDGCSVRLFDSNGRYKNFVAYSDIHVKFARLTYASCSNRFMAWIPHEKDLAMLSSTFEVVEKLENSLIAEPILELVYNEDRNEIISIHCDHLIIWQFRYANKHLIPRSTIHLNLKDKLTTIYAIERTQKAHQRFFLANDCSVTVIELSMGNIIANYLSLHERMITALTFFNPLKLLVTGCRVGSIKIWSFSNMEITLMMVFVGHLSSINYLAFFPGGCQATVASCGNDNTLRVWSLDLNDEVECLDLEYSSKMIGSDITKSTFFTLGSNFIDIWCQNYISEDLLSLTSSPTSIELVTDNPKKMLISCQNNLLFFMKLSKDNQVITRTVISNLSNLSKSMTKILSTVYLENRNMLLVLVQDNQILHYDTRTQPMKQVSCSEYVSESLLLLLTAYKQGSEFNSQSQNKSLILSGSDQGWILVHDLNRLENITFQIEAHPDSAIACMISDPLNSKFFTSGKDNTIKVWHVYPFALEPLSKILSFFCGLLPSNLININNYLFTVFHDPDGGQYPSVVYNIQTRGRYDHSPNYDHIEPVNSVSACSRMKLFLTCSAGSENVIKIWTCKNVFLRQIEMHVPVHYAVFSSWKSDILAAIGKQICFIDHNKFLPKTYIKKQALMHFEPLSDDNEDVLEFNDDIFQKCFDSEDRDKMQGIKSVYRYQSYADILTKTESDEIDRINQERKTNFDKLKAVEDDISNIQHGDYQKPLKRYEKFLKMPMKSDVFDLYFSKIVKYSKVHLPPEEKEESGEGLKIRIPDKYRKSEKKGFFPPREYINKAMAPDNIRKGGYIPNSLIVQNLWPASTIKENADIWKPPNLSLLDVVTKESPKIEENEEGGSEEGDSKFFDWGSDEESAKDPLPIAEEVQSEKLSDDVLSKYGSLLESKPSSIEETKENVIEKSLPESTNVSEVTKRPSTTKSSLKLPEIIRKPKTMPDMRKVKFISSPETSFISNERSLDSENSKLQSDSQSLFITQVPDQDGEKISILPYFLSQFVTENWFLKICPLPHNDTECLKHLPSPLNTNSFGMHILELLGSTDDPEDAVGMVKTIRNLYTEGSIERSNRAHISSMIERKINELMTLDNKIKINLIKCSLDLLASLGGMSDKTVIIICLSRFFDADPDLKGFIKSILYRLGLEDNTDIIGKELATFKLSIVKPGIQRLEDLRKLVSDWLEKLFVSMNSFAAKSQEIIGQEIHLIETQHGKISNIALVQLENVKSIFHLQITSRSDLGLLDPIEKDPRSLLNYINCLNYCRFKQLQNFQKNNNLDSKVSSTKKTIVTLPKLNPEKQCLVRLGESNALQLKSKKDFVNLNSVCNKNSITDNTMHPSMQPFHNYQIALGGGFVPFLHLRMKPCLVNPFPSEEDYIEWDNANPQSILKNYNRAFIPQFSLPPEPF